MVAVSLSRTLFLAFEHTRAHSAQAAAAEQIKCASYWHSIIISSHATTHIVHDISLFLLQCMTTVRYPSETPIIRHAHHYYRDFELSS